MRPGEPRCSEPRIALQACREIVRDHLILKSGKSAGSLSFAEVLKLRKCVSQGKSTKMMQKRVRDRLTQISEKVRDHLILRIWVPGLQGFATLWVRVTQSNLVSHQLKYCNSIYSRTISQLSYQWDFESYRTVSVIVFSGSLEHLNYSPVVDSNERRDTQDGIWSWEICIWKKIWDFSGKS